MNTVLVSVIFLLGAPSDLNQKDKYFLNCNNPTTDYWIENSQHEKIVVLEKYELYHTNRLHSLRGKDGRLQDNGQRVRLYSQLGFTLDNIPFYSNRFYNEGIEIFLFAERLLPQTYQCLKNGRYKTREINTCRFHMPFSPFINARGGDTRFWVDGNNGRIEVWGVAPYAGADEAEVTLGRSGDKNSDVVILHEYIHMCGYGNAYHDHPIFKCAFQ